VFHINYNDTALFKSSNNEEEQPTTEVSSEEEGSDSEQPMLWVAYFYTTDSSKLSFYWKAIAWYFGELSQPS